MSSSYQPKRKELAKVKVVSSENYLKIIRRRLSYGIILSNNAHGICDVLCTVHIPGLSRTTAQ